MIKGIGTDIVSVDRIKKVFVDKERLNRIFTDKEIALFKENYERYSGNFALKEAFSKALGTGIRGFNLKDMEFLRDEYGKPYITTSSLSKLKGKNIDLNEMEIHLSISHEKEYAVAFVIIETRK